MKLCPLCKTPVSKDLQSAAFNTSQGPKCIIFARNFGRICIWHQSLCDLLQVCQKSPCSKVRNNSMSLGLASVQDQWNLENQQQQCLLFLWHCPGISNGPHETQPNCHPERSNKQCLCSLGWEQKAVKLFPPCALIWTMSVGFYCNSFFLVSCKSVGLSLEGKIALGSYCTCDILMASASHLFFRPHFHTIRYQKTELSFPLINTLSLTFSQTSNARLINLEPFFTYFDALGYWGII